jgi:uncharacterized YigZ family protein
MTGRITRTIARPGSSEIVVKRSRFICTLRPVESEEQARSEIEAIRIHFWDASHNCSAYRIGTGGRFQRSNDDGEPVGTAGAPMLAVLTHRDLADVLAVVTRYFGGTLLGAGGLIRAYGQAVTDAADSVGIVERQPVLLVEVDAEHAEAGKLENALRVSRFSLGAIRHGERVTFEIRLDEGEVVPFEAWLADATHGRCRPRIAGRIFVDRPVLR